MPEVSDDGASSPQRDGLGWACFLIHISVMVFFLTGWAVESRTVLIFYLVFLPAVVLHWQLNRNTCVLNNLESLIRGGRWRDPANLEEGVWLLTLTRRFTGLRLTASQMDVATYVTLAVLWGLGWWHLLGWPPP